MTWTDESIITIALTFKNIIAKNTSAATAAITTAISDTARNAVTKNTEIAKSATNYGP